MSCCCFVFKNENILSSSQHIPNGGIENFLIKEGKVLRIKYTLNMYGFCQKACGGLLLQSCGRDANTTQPNSLQGVKQKQINIFCSFLISTEWNRLFCLREIEFYIFFFYSKVCVCVCSSLPLSHSKVKANVFPICRGKRRAKLLERQKEMPGGHV